jgi:hypothetical protein
MWSFSRNRAINQCPAGRLTRFNNYDGSFPSFQLAALRNAFRTLAAPRSQLAAPNRHYDKKTAFAAVF